MKKILITLVLTVFSYCFGFSQATFSVKPGLNLLGADFGYRINKIEPYFGLKSVGVKFNYEYDDNIDRSEEELKLNVLLPHLGVKYQVGETESIRTFVNMSVYKPILMGSRKTDNQNDDDFKDELKRLKAMGIELGFAAEYYFDEHFSLGSEFGIRYAFGRYEYDEPGLFTSEKARLNMTYALISFN